MVTLNLDPTNQQRLEALAKQRGADASQIVAQIVEAYLDAQNWKHDSTEAWAESSVALSGEVFGEEDWADGSE